MIARWIDTLRERANIVRGCFFAFLGFAVLFDFIIDRPKPHFFGDTIIGFWSIFGLLGCLLMIIICKGLSHVWLERKEDPYDN